VIYDENCFRYEFTEILVRITRAKFNLKMHADVVPYLIQILDDHIEPYLRHEIINIWGVEDWRHKVLFPNEEVGLLITLNMVNMRTLHKQYGKFSSKDA
jgi:hypothetical protein